MAESKWRTIPWLKILRVLGVCCAACIIAMGIYELVMDDRSIKSVVSDLYRIFFGVLIIVAEMQWTHMLVWFSFLASLIGLGAFYIFVGGLALGGDWWAVTLAIIMVVIGLVYCMSGLACQDDRPKAVSIRTQGGWKDPDTGEERAMAAI